MKYILVGVAGIIGAVLRYSLGIAIAHSYPSPIATWFINMLGCFFLAFLTASIFKMKGLHPYIAPAIGTGLIGSFTTFSTFSVETLQFLQEPNYRIAFLYVFASLVGGLFMAWAGFRLGNKVWKRFIQEEA
ncbi:fluoride efflux transporter CrcB [Ectobacillus polymachus]|uniref:fluoride efflux transporter CrcB n=1 Tax=Ectobacillus polymachus TaxID=1508806 RepID=UPI003A8B140D